MESTGPVLDRDVCEMCHEPARPASADVIRLVAVDRFILLGKRVAVEGRAARFHLSCAAQAGPDWREPRYS